jgi:hypothetical protein
VKVSSRNKVLQPLSFFQSEASFLKVKFAPTEIFVPTQWWRPAQLVPRCHVGTNLHLASFLKCPQDFPGREQSQGEQTCL